VAKERKPRRKEKSGRISGINLGTGWQPYDGGQVARDMSERRRKTIAPRIIKTELAPGKQQYQEMLSWITVLERLIIELPKQPPGIGHNRPPISQEEVRKIRQAVAILKAQPVVPTAPDKARAAGSTVMKFGERLGSYLLKQAGIFISEATKSAGKEFGKRLVQSPFWWALATTLLMLGHSVEAWLR
jgi:hypothetical protein